jgi:hypothetical protein
VNYIPLNCSHPTGLTWGSLFADWPKERLAQITLSAIPPDLDFCPNTMQLRLDRFTFPPRRLLSLIAGVQSGKPGQDAARANSGPTRQDAGPSQSSRLKGLIGREVSSLIVDLMAFGSYRMDDENQRWVGQFGPDVIYSELGSA